MPQLQIDLPEALEKYVKEKVATGEFDSPGAFVAEVIVRHRWREQVEAKVLAAQEANDFAEVTPEVWQSLRQLATGSGEEHGQ